ncbi:MAG TPA: alternative ribosome rescue aminoacyl-tRNA hydrolase ArfB [Methylococcales bacterium]
MIEIKNGIVIDEQELSFITARSSGPGGQNVNKLSTKVTVNFDVLSSPNLDEQQREKILTRLANRISKEGILSVVCQESRSQLDNKQEAVKRLVELLRNALTEKTRRIKTKAPKSAAHKRLDKKKRHGEIKKWRSKTVTSDQ